MGLRVLGFRLWGFGLRVLGLRVQGFGLLLWVRVQGSGFRGLSVAPGG